MPGGGGAQLGNRRDRVLRRKFGAYNEGVAGGCRKVYNKELLEQNSSNIIRIIQSLRIRWAGHVACTWYGGE